MPEDIRISEFNELQFKMIRIHKLQDQINELFVNPLSPNLAFGDYNYNLLVSIIRNLYAEVHSKCTDEEREEINNLLEDIDNLMEDEPPYQQSNHPTGRKAILDNDNWKKLRKKIHTLNLKVRGLLDAHGYNPDKNYELDGL